MAQPIGSSQDSFLVTYFKANPAPWQMGEIVILPDFTLLHRDDAARPLTDLRVLTKLCEIREVMRLDRDGEFRPLRAAPTLCNGWRYQATGVEEVQLVLNYLYPAGVANASLWQQHLLTPTPWMETAQRQTGRFRIVRELDEATLHAMVAETCDHGCLKRRLWSPAEQDVTVALGEIPLLCPEACNFLVGKAREKLKGPGEE